MSALSKTLQKFPMSMGLLFGCTIWLWSLTVWGNTGIITTVAGNGTSGFSGDGGLAINANMTTPIDIALDNSGNLYISDATNYRIRKVNVTNATITTMAGNGVDGFSGDGGSSLTAKLGFTSGITIDSSNNLYFVDRSNHRIRKINSTTGTINTVAGTGTHGFSGDGSTATTAKISNVEGIAFDTDGNIYIADTDNDRIRKIDAITKNISTIAGTGTRGFNGDGLISTNTQLNLPTSVAVDDSGNIYIADYGNHRIRQINKLTNKVSTIAGNGIANFSGDGSNATNSTVNLPKGITIDKNGNIYFSDMNNHRIRKIDISTGIINTIAGNGIGNFSGDGTAATDASLKSPGGIALDHDGNLYIADTNNFRIRKVSLASGSPNKLSVDPPLMPLDRSTAQSLVFTVGYDKDANTTMTLGTPTVSGYYASQFNVATSASNDCSGKTLNAGDSCTVSVNYTPDPNYGLPNTTGILNIIDSLGVTHTQALMTSSESANGQAARRLPDVLTNVTVPALTVGNPATITWTMTGYQTDAHSQIALFECTTDGAGNAVNTCGDTYASRTAASEVLSPTTTADGAWTYLGVRAKDRTYSYTYTPTKTGPVVLRFYQKSGIDKAAGNTGTSLLIPGGLNGSGSSFTYFDAEGRRIKAIVQ